MLDWVFALFAYGRYDGRSAFVWIYILDGGHCPTNSDVAGISVVLSAVFASAWVTLASILVVYLDGRCARSAVLPKWIQAPLSNGVQPEDEKGYKRIREGLALSVRTLTDTQTFTGFTLLVSCYVNLPHTQETGSIRDLTDAHFTLAIYLACLSSASHLASLLVLKDYFQKHKTIATVRLAIIVSFGSVLVTSIDLSEHAFEPFFLIFERILNRIPREGENRLEYAIPALIGVYIFGISLLTLMETWKDDFCKMWHKKGRQILNIYFKPGRFQRVRGPLKILVDFIVFSQPFLLFVVQICFSVISLTFALLQKFTPSPTPSAGDQIRFPGIQNWCSLSNAQDNAWSVGQVNAALLLIVPLILILFGWYEIKGESHHNDEETSDRYDPPEGHKEISPETLKKQQDISRRVSEATVVGIPSKVFSRDAGKCQCCQ